MNLILRRNFSTLHAVKFILSDAAKQLLKVHDGEVQKIILKKGDPVKVDDVVLEIETFKFPVIEKAPSDGIIDSICVESGQKVFPGDVLYKIQCN